MQGRTKSNPSIQRRQREQEELPISSIRIKIKTNVKEVEITIRLTLVSSFSCFSNLTIISIGQRNSSFVFRTSGCVLTANLLSIYSTCTIGSIPLRRCIIWRILEQGSFWLASNSLPNRNGITHYCLLILSDDLNIHTESSDTICVGFGSPLIYPTALVQLNMKIYQFLFVVLSMVGYNLDGRLHW